MKRVIMRSLNANSLMIFTLIALSIMVSACTQEKSLATIQIEEQNGLDRILTYVSVEIPLINSLKNSEMLMVIDSESGTSIPVQVVDTIQDQGTSKLTILFPIAIKANTTRTFQLMITDKMNHITASDIELSKDALSVENKTYKAFFSSEYDERGGQINGILLKDFDNQLLKRGHISMHWAPNFSKSISDSYFNFEHLSSSSLNDIRNGRYQIVKIRSGTTDSVPEIDLKGKYSFYGGLPYFEFESTMLMKKDVTLNLLRNDEMTMDSLFTHVVYKKKDGKISRLKLYDQELDVLETNPIPDDAAFVAFYHRDKGYGLGSIRLEYDNTNESGNPSPTYHPYTKISKSSSNGRYWNRILTDTIQKFPKGSRYTEKNAYLIFKVDKDIPEKEILYYQERLLRPLHISLK